MGSVHLKPPTSLPNAILTPAFTACVISALLGLFALDADMGVRVNQPGQHGGTRRKIDHGGPSGRVAAFGDTFNLVATDDNQHIVPGVVRDAVNQRGGVNDGDLLLRGNGSLRPAWGNERQRGQQQDNGQNCSAAHHVSVLLNARKYEYPFRRGYSIAEFICVPEGSQEF